jgi:hypothetical protein
LRNLLIFVAALFGGFYLTVQMLIVRTLEILLSRPEVGILTSG